MAMKQLNLEKAFNLRFTSFDRKDDMPTPRELAEPIPTGHLAGWKIDKEKYNGMLDEYYEIHDWDTKRVTPRGKHWRTWNSDTWPTTWNGWGSWAESVFPATASSGPFCSGPSMKSWTTSRHGNNDRSHFDTSARTVYGHLRRGAGACDGNLPLPARMLSRG